MRKKTGNINQTKTVAFNSHVHQAKACLSKKFIVALLGGVGCGKTHVGSMWSYLKIKNMKKGQLGLIAANSYSQLKDSTLRSLYKNFEEWGIEIKPKVLPKGTQPLTLEIWNGKCWIEVLARSLDNYEMLSGTELHFAWSDETFQTSMMALEIITDRLRDESNGHDAQFLLTTTVDDPGSALYEFLVENYNEDIMDVFTATTYDNIRNLPKNYISRLKAIHTERMFKRMVLSEWVSLDSANIYYAFDRTKNVSNTAEFRPDLPICWMHDFNIGEGKPMSSALGHIIDVKDEDGNWDKEVHIFDEIILKSSDTNDAVEEYKNRSYLNDTRSTTIVYGDASGSSKDTRSKKTDYKIISNAGFTKHKVPKKNPPIRTRHNSMNALFKTADGKVKMFINPRCKTIIKGAETSRLKTGANYIEHEDYSQHVMTAIGYFAVEEFNIDTRITQVRKLNGL